MATYAPITLHKAGYGSLADTDPVAGAVAGAPLLTPGATPTGTDADDSDSTHQPRGCKQWCKHFWRCIDGEMTWLGAHELAGSALNMYAATRKRAFALASLVVVFRGIGQGAIHKYIISRVVLSSCDTETSSLEFTTSLHYIARSCVHEQSRVGFAHISRPARAIALHGGLRRVGHCGGDVGASAVVVEHSVS